MKSLDHLENELERRENTRSAAAHDGCRSETFLVASVHMLTRVPSTNEVGQFQVKCLMSLLSMLVILFSSHSKLPESQGMGIDCSISISAADGFSSEILCCEKYLSALNARMAG